MPKAKSQAESLQLLSKQATYEVAGKSYSLVMSHRVILEWEQLTGLAYFVDLGKVFDRPTLKGLGAMLFCLLVLGGYEGSYDDILTHLYKAGNLKAAAVAVNAAYLASQVEPDPGAVENPQKPTTQE